MKFLMAVILVTSFIGASAYAQSAVRADEKNKNPEIYRLGDSEDLQADQIIVDHVKSEKIKRQDLNAPAQFKRLLKHHDMI